MKNVVQIIFCFLTLAHLSANQAFANQQKISELNTQLEIWNEQTKALDRIANRSLLLTAKNSPLELWSEKNPLRTETRIELARSHFNFGDYLRALQVASAELNKIDELNSNHGEALAHITVASLMKLGNLRDAGAKCQELVSRPSQNSNLKDSSWLENCAWIFSKGTHSFLPIETRITHEELSRFAYSSVKGEEVKLHNAILLFGAFQNLKFPDDAKNYLNKSIQNSSSQNKWYTRAVFTKNAALLFQARPENSLSTLKYIATNKNKPDGIPTLTIDDYSKFLAQSTLARYYYSNDQLNTSEAWYRMAMIDSRNSKFPEEIKWEFADLLYQSGKNAEALETYSSLLRDSYKENQPQSLRTLVAFNRIQRLQSKLPGTLQSSAQKNLISVLGVEEEDIRYLREITKLKGNTSEAKLLQELEIIVRIARQKNITSPLLKRLDAYVNTLNQASVSTNNEKYLLASMLIPTLETQHASLDTSKSIANALHTQSQDILRSVELLNSVSYKHWDLNELASRNAKSHAAELMRLINGQDDAVALWTKKNLSNFVKNDRLISDIKSSLSLIQQNEARMASTLWLTKNQGIKPAAEKSTQIELQKDNFIDVLIDTQLSILQSDGGNQIKELVDTLTNQLSSLRDLVALHERMFANIESKELAIEIKALIDTWKHLIEFQEQRVITAKNSLEKNQSEFRYLSGEAQSLKRAIDSQILAMHLLRSSLLEDLTDSLPEAADIILPIASNNRDRARVAMADSDIKRAKEIERFEKELNRASQERKSWHRTLKSSLDTGSAR